MKSILGNAFDGFDPQSKVWIFLSDSEISAGLQSQITKAIQAFLHTWNAHGTPLKSSAKILLDHILIIAVDEAISHPSGCSIDKLMIFIQQLEQDFSLTLLDRNSVAFLKEEKLEIVKLNILKEQLASGLINPELLLLQLNLNTISDIEKHLFFPMKDTWLNRYIKRDLPQS